MKISKRARNTNLHDEYRAEKHDDNGVARTQQAEGFDLVFMGIDAFERVGNGP